MNNEEIKELHYILSEIGKGDSYDEIEKFIENRENKYINLIKFLRKQVTDSCCHSLLDEDDVVDEIDKILNGK